MTNSLISYDDLLSDIKGEVFKAGQNIERIVARQKIEMGWNIGKAINEYLEETSGTIYGQKIFEKLAGDVGLNSRVLYQMSGFHKKYPTLPKDDGVLNWSHYRELIKVEDDKKRDELAVLTIENNLGANVLQKKISQQRSDLKLQKKANVKQKLKVSRGALFNYKIIEENAKKFVDLGFKVFSEIETDFGVNDGILTSVKKGQKFDFVKSEFLAKQLHTYKAYVDKVVDGDTLNVTLDLGFKVRYKQILRLAQINTPEKNSAGGKKATQFLKKILSNVEFVVIKTNKIDIYGRYVADIFYLEGEDDVTEVASKGQYLNQILVNEGLALVV